jgi:hypothetical protein
VFHSQADKEAFRSAGFKPATSLGSSKAGKMPALQTTSRRNLITLRAGKAAKEYANTATRFQYGTPNCFD